MVKFLLFKHRKSDNYSNRIFEITSILFTALKLQKRSQLYIIEERMAIVNKNGANSIEYQLIDKENIIWLR